MTLTAKIEDINSYNGTTHYPVCNESVKIHRELLEGIEVDRAASICSGGEISFFAVLPHVRKEVLLIDHSYVSMYYALAKYGLVEKKGPKEAWELLAARQDPYYDMYNTLRNKTTKPSARVALTEIGAELPEQFRKHASTIYGSCTGAWQELTQKDVVEFDKNKEKLTFLHGDIGDLVERGPFDLLYLSNALDYMGRNGQKFGLEKLVKQGAYVLCTGCRYGRGYDGLIPSTWKIVKERPRTYKDPYSSGLSWDYYLFQVGKDVKPRAKSA